MDTWRRTFAQFRDLLNGMAPSQRMTLVMVPLLVLGALGAVMYYGGGTAEEALLAGKVFSAEELRSAQEALQRGGMTQFRVENQRILAPKTDIPRYNAALMTNSGMPTRFGEELEKVFEGSPLFSGSDRQRLERLDTAKAKELVAAFRMIPEIQDARVLWERARGRGFSGPQKMTATLSIMPKGNAELSSDRLRDLRQAVASAWGMAADDVTVLNLKTGELVRPPDKNDAHNTEYLDAHRRYTSMYQRKIAEALGYIQNAIVTVNVELDTLVQSREQERKYDKQAFPFRSVEQTETQTANEARPGNEPGMLANQPRSVRAPATTNSSNNSERSLTSNDSVPVKTTVSDRVYQGLTPKSVRVAVSIPKDYYRAVAIQQGADEKDKAAFQARLQQIQQQIEKEVSQHVASLIPAPIAGPSTDLVNVRSYDRLEPVETAIAVPVTAQVGDALAQWGGAAGLGLFALWALWMLQRSMKKMPEVVPAAAAAAAAGGSLALLTEEEPETNPIPKELTRRDKLQVLVKDNPEMAAAVLRRWLVPQK